MKHVARIALAALISLQPLAAYAEAPEGSAPEGSDQAREHFQHGVEFYKEQSFDAALAEFTRAYELQANYRVLFNIGQVQFERHDYVAALKLFRSYLDAGGDDIPAQRREQVEHDESTLRRRVAELQVKCDVPGAEITLDGVTVGKTPTTAPLLLNPGTVHVLVQKPGYVSEAQTLNVVGSEQKSLVIRLLPEVTATAPSPAAPEPSPRPSSAQHGSRAPFWIGLGVTGALAIGAGAFAFQTHDANQGLDHELDTFPGDPDGIASARSRLKRDALVTDVLTGGALVAAGLTVYFALSSQGDSERPAALLRLRPSACAHGLELLADF